MVDDPGIVFTVKELIGRLDGKLDMLMNVLTNKADRADVVSLDRRVGMVEEKVGELRQDARERLAAATAAEQAEAKVEAKHQDHFRWKVGTYITVGLLMAAIGTIAAMLMGGR